MEILDQEIMTLIRNRTRVVLIVVTISALLFAGCTTPDAVSKFCASAATTLASAKPVFADMKASCMRAADSREAIGAFTAAADDKKNPTMVDAVASCNDIGKQGDGAAAAAAILSDYFSAINALASFGTAKAGTDAGALATKTGAALGANSAAQTAIGSIVGDLASFLTSAYQLKKLEGDLTRVSKNISDVSDGLVKVIQNNYLDQLLADEEQKTAVRYREFYRSDFSPEAKVMLDDRWRADEAAIQAKRASAQSLISALQALSKGFANLASNAHSLKAADLPGLLGPYVAQIQALIPQIQKAF